MSQEQSDTQWPQFEVFIQSKPGQPHKNVGAVHAPDREMALMIARDVYVRRPDCFSMWVVPAGSILRRTAEELHYDEQPPASATGDNGHREPFCVFQQNSFRRSMTYVSHTGDIAAASAEDALNQALAQDGSEHTLVWWIFPRSIITCSEPEDVETLFAPARDKPYRHPSYYRTMTFLRNLKKEEDEGNHEAPAEEPV